MLEHNPSQENPTRGNLLFDSVARRNYDGLSNLETLNLKIVQVIDYALYTLLKIDVNTMKTNYFS